MFFLLPKINEIKRTQDNLSNLKKLKIALSEKHHGFFVRADVYCAPNTGGESFGIVLVEAMAAGTAVVASDLDAFRRVLRDGEAGRLVAVDDAPALAAALIEVLDDDALRAAYVAAGSEAVRRFDWSVVADQIVRVYETVAGSGNKVTVGD